MEIVSICWRKLVFDGVTGVSVENGGVDGNNSYKISEFVKYFLTSTT